MVPPKTPEESEATPPSPTLLKKLESATFDAASKLLDMPKKPKAARIAKLLPEQVEQLRKIEEEAIAEFRGDLCPRWPLQIPPSVAGSNSPRADDRKGWIVTRNGYPLQGGWRLL
jgi:hypothetical protein